MPVSLSPFRIAAWIGAAPADLEDSLQCTAKVRYRQPDQACRVAGMSNDTLRVTFETPQRAVAPGQYVVFYAGDRCLGGGVIDQTAPVTDRGPASELALQAAGR